MNNGTYINPYVNPYNQQSVNNMQLVNNYDDYLKYLEKEKDRVEKSKEQYINRFQQQPTLNQTIQVTPTPNQTIGIKHVKNASEVNNELVMAETSFILDDYSTLFIKNARGEIRTFEMKEIIPKDEKDILIEKLTKENEKLKGMIIDESANENDNEQFSTELNESIKTKTTSNVSVPRASKAKSK